MPDRKDNVITYTIIATPNGKGYGCFGIKRLMNETDEFSLFNFEVKASFCSPWDRSSFTKKRARELLRQATRPSVIVSSSAPDPHPKDLVSMAVVAGLPLPTWARKSFQVGSVAFRLTKDHMNVMDLVKAVSEEKEAPEVYVKFLEQNVNSKESMLSMLACELLDSWADAGYDPDSECCS